jgi:EmrB/QacA subfamily drug resistance transporter
MALSRGAATAAAQELGWLKRWVILGIVCVGVFMNTLDTGITDVLNPVFTAQFHLNLYVEYWIELSYAIPLIGMLLPAGHLGDTLGRKNVFLSGMILFGGGSGLLTLMPTFETMFIARVIQGLGAACISANGGVLAVSAFPWKMRGQVLGMIGTAVALGLKLGPVVGGFLADNFGWRSAFLINVAIGITFVILGSNIIPASQRITGRKFDFWGAILFVATMACFLVIINQGPTLGFLSPQILTLAAGCVVFGYLFFRVSTTVKNPTIDLGLYRIRNFTVSVTAAFISFLALTPVNHLLPFYMENVQGLQVSETGLLFITTTLAIAVTQPFSGRWADRIGSRPVASLGLLLQGIGLVMLAFIPLHMDPNWLVPELVLVGVGVGLFRSPNHRALFGAVPRDKMGQAGGYQHLPRQLGESIGETGVVTMFTAIVLASAAVAGIHVAQATTQPAVVAAVPTPAPLPTVAPVVPAGAAGRIAVPQPATVVDTNTADDNIVDVGDDSAAESSHAGLSQAITSLPADIQMLGYRLMWALAGVIALGGAAISWFMRDEEAEQEADRRASAPPQRAVPARP